MILITGATGHLGNVIVSDLVKNNKKVRAFVLPKDDVTHLQNPLVEIVYGNVLDYQSVSDAVNGCNYIIHTAALVSIGNNFKVKDVLNVNVNGLENVLIAAMDNNVKKVVYISSIHAFNELKSSLEITEETPTNPKKNKTPYAKSKGLAMEVVKKYRLMGLDIDVLFPTGIIGPYDYRKGNNALYSIRQILKSKGKTIFYFSAGYDFVDVRDVSKVTINMLGMKSSNNQFIISGEYISLGDIYLNVADILNRKVRLIKVPNFLVIFGVCFAYIFAKILRLKMPITPQALNILASKHRTSSKKLKTVMNYNPRSVISSLKDSVDYMVNFNKEKTN